MVAKNLLIGVFLCLLGTTAIATTRSPRLTSPEFCNLQQLTTTQPAQRLEFEGGTIDVWDSNDEQFQCVGASPLRTTMQPNTLYLPSFHASPRLVFIEEGHGIIGIQLPGCAETFDTGIQGQQQQPQQEQPRRMRGGLTHDSHQKVHRFKRGDIIAIPAGTVHWAYNDGNEEVVAIAINDMNNPANQLDLQPWTFHLAGGISSQHIQGQGRQQGQRGQGQQGQRGQGQQGQRGPQGQQGQRGQGRRWKQQGTGEVGNIYAGFDPELLAESFNSDLETVTAMQQSTDRGVIVNVQEPMQFVTPDEQQLQQQPRSSNGIEEKICTSKIFYNLDNQREADIFSEQAGKLNMVNEHKLPILSYMDLSAEKGHLQQNALFSPHWSINSHTIIYVLSGDAQVQVVSNNGEAVLDEQVNKGDVFVVPQFFATTARAGQNGFEWVAFKTNKSPMKSPVAGYTSVFRAMPLEVITNSYDVSPSQAQSLKTNRGTESILFSPQTTGQIS